jgi:F420-dependent oxidoreductase-like protein
MDRIGLTFGSRTGDTREIISLAQRAEALGYETFWLGESWGRESLTILSYVAAKTDRIGIATGIVNVFSRSAAIIAQAAATLDELSGGRFTLGLGTSGPILVEQWHGVPYANPLQRTREYIEVIRLVLSGERVNYNGELLHLERFRLPFTPPRRQIPVFVAAFGPKNLALTGELADGWLPIYLHPGRYDDMTARIEAGARRAGRQLSDIRIDPWILTAVVESEDEREQVLRQVRGQIAFYAAGMGPYYTALFRRYGFDEEMDGILDAWRSGDRDGAAGRVSARMTEALAVVGAAAYCRDRYEFYRRRGATVPVVSLPPGLTPDQVDRTLKAMAPAS